MARVACAPFPPGGAGCSRQVAGRGWRAAGHGSQIVGRRSRGAWKPPPAAMHPCACARGATRHTFAWRASARRDARGRTRRALEAPRRRNIEALRIRARRRRHRASDSFTVHPRHGLREIVIVRSDRIPLYRRGRRALHHVRVLPPQHGSVQAADRQGLRSRRHARVPAPVAARRRAQARRSRPARHADLRAGQEPPGHPRRAAEKKGRAAGVGRPFPDQAGRTWT